jgi:hypothetical protein
MPLELIGSQNGFTFEEFFKRFSLRYQNICVNCFIAFLNFGFDNCGNWFDN